MCLAGVCWEYMFDTDVQNARVFPHYVNEIPFEGHRGFPYKAVGSKRLH